jgi:hypothetical protein
MTAQLTRSSETTSPGNVGRARRWLWLAALLVAMAAAAVVGIAVAAQVTRPAPDPWTVYNEPNANTREGRVTTYQEPNANTREGRVPMSHTGPASWSRP